MPVSAALIAAYSTTRYVVIAGDQCQTARIGAADSGVDRLLAGHGSAGGIFITAWNPFSQVRSRALNEADHHRLCAAVAAEGYRALDHVGVGDDPAWTPEEGLFVLDMALGDALRLARQFRQNAVMVYEAAVGGRLVVLDWSLT